jgi:transcriptional regulator with XRE-family HTH domain
MNARDLRKARINAGFSVRSFARHLDVPEQTIRRLESGQGISLAYAKKVADYFEVTVLDLMPELIEGAAA